MWRFRWVVIPAVCLVALATQGWAQLAEPKVSLKFEKTPIREAAKQLGEQLGTLIVVDDEVQGESTVKAEVPAQRAVALLAVTVGARPVRAVIFCTADEAKGETTLKRDTKVTLAFAAGTKLSAAAAQLAEKAGMVVRTTPATADLPVELKLDDKPLAEACDQVAQKAGCKWVLGWLLKPIDPKEVTADLEALAKLPPEQQQKLVDQAVDRALGEYRKMSPEERREAVGRAAGMLNNFADRLQHADPETRKRFREITAPLIERGIRRFVALDTQEQAELMPLVKALARLRQ